MVIMNDTWQMDDFLFMSPSQSSHESHNMLAVMTWPLFMIGVFLKFIEWLEDIV